MWKWFVHCAGFINSVYDTGPTNIFLQHLSTYSIDQRHVLIGERISIYSWILSDFNAHAFCIVGSPTTPIACSPAPTGGIQLHEKGGGCQWVPRLGSWEPTKSDELFPCRFSLPLKHAKQSPGHFPDAFCSLPTTFSRTSWRHFLNSFCLPHP